MSLWAEYSLERANIETIENDVSFLTYKIELSECFIQDAYVQPGARNIGIGAEMIKKLETIARERGCKFVTCFVCPGALHADVSLKAVIGVGFKLFGSSENVIIFKKEL